MLGQLVPRITRPLCPYVGSHTPKTVALPGSGLLNHIDALHAYKNGSAREESLNFAYQFVFAATGAELHDLTHHSCGEVAIDCLDLLHEIKSGHRRVPGNDDVVRHWLVAFQIFASK